MDDKTAMTDSELKNYTEANRAAWNEVIPVHQRAARQKWDQRFSQPGYVSLDDLEIGMFERVGIRGKRVVHLCCNNGVELLSIKNLGAARCVGFDIADEAIREASERALRCHIDCEFVRSDVYEIDGRYNTQFDIAYMSVGCLGWMPDLSRFFGKAASLLGPHGVVFIHEIHPFVDMLPVDDPAEAASLRIVGPYFKDEPYAEQGGLDYVGNSDYAATKTEYWFVHTLSSILMGLIDNGITIEHFSEYPTAVSPEQRKFEQANAGIPLSFTLIGRKQGTGKHRKVRSGASESSGPASQVVG